MSKATGANYPAVTGKVIKASKIPLPSLPVQKRIAAALEKADTLRGQCQQMEQEFNTLGQSVFLDMFGDPVMNPKSWPESTLGNVLKIKHGFAFKSEYFTNSGNYVLLTPGNFYEEGGYRDRGDKQKFYTGDIPEGYTLKENDLLVAMTEQAEGLLGSSILIPSSNMFLHNQRLGLVNFLNNQNKTFFAFLFNSHSVRKAIQATATGIKVKHTSPTKLEAISIGIPPIELQDSFEKIVNKINVQIETIKKEQQKSESQFNSLMQLAFKGELEFKDVA
jgi:type I restriction enzyme S subunit